MLGRWVAVSWVVMVLACGGSDEDPGQGTLTATGKSVDSSLSATAISGASSARVQDGTTVVSVGETTSPTGGFSVLIAGTPAVGTYAVTTTHPPATSNAYVEIWESGSADEFWHASGGTVQVTSIADGRINVTLTGVTMIPTPTLGGTGTFTVSGTVVAVLAD